MMHDTLIARLRHLASQENCDGETYDSMVEAADRLSTIEREIGGRRESYRAMRDFMDTDPVARSCYQGFINTLDELRAIIDAPDE